MARSDNLPLGGFTVEGPTDLRGEPVEQGAYIKVTVAECRGRTPQSKALRITLHAAKLLRDDLDAILKAEGLG